MKIAIGSDHVGYRLKMEITEYLKSLNHVVKDFGTDNEERTDYPIYAKRVGKAVASGGYDCGILICGTGVGMSIAANKINGIRAVACSEPYSAMLSKRHNNTNILTLGARVVGTELAKMIVDMWLNASYEGGRHQARLDMIRELECENQL